MILVELTKHPGLDTEQLRHGYLTGSKALTPGTFLIPARLKGEDPFPAQRLI